MKNSVCLTLCFAFVLAGCSQAADTPAFTEIRLGNTFSVMSGNSGFITAAFSPDGTKIIVGARDNAAYILDAESGKELHKLPHTAWVRIALFSPDGKKIVTSGDKNPVRVWDTESGKELYTLGKRININAAPFSPDSKRIVTVIPFLPNEKLEADTYIWDAESGEKLLTLKHENYWWGPNAVFSPDSKKIATVIGGVARIWDIESGEELQKSEKHVENMSGNPVFSPDGKKIAAANRGNTVRIWNVESGEVLQTLEGHTKSLNTIVFSPDGTKIVTTSEDETARIWEAESGKEILKLGNPDDRINRSDWLYGRRYSTAKIQFNKAVFSPDGRYVLTQGNQYDRTARIWDSESGKELYVLRHSGVSSIVASFSPDSKKIVTSPGQAGGSTIRIWTLK